MKIVTGSKQGLRNWLGWKKVIILNVPLANKKKESAQVYKMYIKIYIELSNSPAPLNFERLFTFLTGNREARVAQAVSALCLSRFGIDFELKQEF